VTSFLYGLKPHTGQLFSPSSLDLSLSYSTPTVIANIVNIPLLICALAYTVEKANKCLDFTFTIFFIHFVLTSVIYKFPSAMSWWLWHAIIITCTVLASEFVCLKLETAEIKLSFGHIIEKGVTEAKKIISKKDNKGENKGGDSKARKNGKRKDKIEDV
jgi:hypothetical protein